MKPLGEDDSFTSSILASDALQQHTVNIYNYEQLFLFGIPPDKTEDDKPEVLIAYPSSLMSDIIPSVILDHAMPLGTKKRQKIKFSSSLIEEEFCFTIKKGNSNLYCVSAMFVPNVKKLPFFVSSKTKKTLFAFCIVSRIPSLASHLNFLTFLINAMCDQVPNMNIIHVQKDYAFVDEAAKIDGLVITRNIGHSPFFHVPDPFCDLIFLYQICGPGTMPIHLSPKHKLFFPMNDDPRQIVLSGLDTVLSIMDVETLLRLLAGLMLDYQILIIGSSMEEVSVTIMTLAQLIDPLKYSGMIIPMLPQSKNYIDLLGAPVPFIIGTLPCDKLRDIQFLDTIISLNLDKKILEYNHDCPPPPYPQSEFITKTIQQALDKTSKEFTIYSLPEEYMTSLKHKYYFGQKTCESIIQLIRQPFDLVLSDFIYSFFITDLDQEGGSTVFNKQLFIECMNHERFFTELVDSQTFEMWTTKQLEKFQILKGEDIKKRTKRRTIGSASRTRRRSLSTKVLGIG